MILKGEPESEFSSFHMGWPQELGRSPRGTGQQWLLCSHPFSESVLLMSCL